MGFTVVTFVEIVCALSILWIAIKSCFSINDEPDTWPEVWIRSYATDDEQPQRERRPKVDAEVDGQIVFDTFIQENPQEPGGCAICLEEYKYRDTRAGIRACNHRFHALCIKAWLMENDTCPLCRNFLV